MTACCPLSGWGETASVCTTTNRRAAKEHSCDECGERIARGDAYEHVKGLWASSWLTYRTCLSCAEIRSHFGCDGWTFGSLWEDLESNFFPDMTCGGSCFEGLSPAARMRLIEKRMAWLYDGGNATWERRYPRREVKTPAEDRAEWEAMRASDLSYWNREVERWIFTGLVIDKW